MFFINFSDIVYIKLYNTIKKNKYKTFYKNQF